MAAKQGRPTTYTPELAAIICGRIAAGETLVAICKGRGMPCVATVLGDAWMANPEFSAAYARAKKVRLDVMAEEIQQLADAARQGEKVERKHIGWECAVCHQDVRWRGKGWVHSLNGEAMCVGAGKPLRIVEERVTTGDMVERSKLQVDARKWLLSKLAANVYGDKLALGGDPTGQPLQLIVMPSGSEPPPEDPDPES